MTEKSLGIIVKHFCLDSVDSSDEAILFPPQNLNSVVVMDIFGKLIIYSLEDVYNEIKNLTTIEEIKEKLAYKTSSCNINRYYFIDSSTKLKRKTKKNAVYKELTSQSDLSIIESHASEFELENAYISLGDVDPFGVYFNDEIISVCSLLRLDDVYDMGIITRDDYRSKGFARNLMYQYLKLQSKDKLIRLIVSEDNSGMIRICDSLGLTSEIKFLEIKFK